MSVYFWTFIFGFIIGIILTVKISQIINRGLDASLEQAIHYIFKSTSNVRTRTMDSLMKTVEWDFLKTENENGSHTKIWGVLENTTNVEIKTIFFEFRFLDEQGIIIESVNHLEYGNTLPGEKRKIQINVSNIDFYDFNVIARTNAFANIPAFK